MRGGLWALGKEESPGGPILDRYSSLKAMLGEGGPNGANLLKHRGGNTYISLHDH